VEASAITYEELTVSAQNESSASIRSRVEACQNLQNERYAEENFTHNSRIPASKLARYCPLGDKEAAFMEDIFKKQALTARTYHKILRVARTIADLDRSRDIHLRHLTEAVCYRMPGKGYWGGVQ
jgi:magnesium chelatase family protein